MMKFFTENNENEILKKIRKPITKSMISALLDYAEYLLNKKPLQNADVIRSQHLLFIGLEAIYNNCSTEEWKNYIRKLYVYLKKTKRLSSIL